MEIPNFSLVFNLRIRGVGASGIMGCLGIADAFHNATSGKDIEVILKRWKGEAAIKLS